MPRPLCSDPEQDWFPIRVVCHATQARLAAKRRWEALHEAAPWHNGTFDRWAKVRDTDHPFHRDDGVTINVTTDGAELDDTWLRGTPAHP